MPSSSSPPVVVAIPPVCVTVPPAEDSVTFRAVAVIPETAKPVALFSDTLLSPTVLLTVRLLNALLAWVATMAPDVMFVSDNALAVIPLVWVSPPVVVMVTAAGVALAIPDTPSTVPTINPPAVSRSVIAPLVAEAATVPIVFDAPDRLINPPVDVARKLVTAIVVAFCVNAPPAVRLAVPAVIPLPDTAKIARALEST